MIFFMWVGNLNTTLYLEQRYTIVVKYCSNPEYKKNLDAKKK